MTNLILASKSTDRKEIFKTMDINIKYIDSDINEEIFKAKIKDPIKLVKKLAHVKVLNVIDKIQSIYNDAIIIGADTIVELEGEIIGKPLDEDDAIRILGKLSGKKHNIFTGISILRLPERKNIIDYDKTEVEFLSLSDDEIDLYIQTQEWKGKAGAYSLREKAGLFIKSIKGSHSNILGLPMQKLYKILINEFNINLLSY
ncbi:MAG: septum formation protein Maf [Candidatus Lokiarchaeota archaeon]|nr:septum formation protein Maf [Candidatus Lokiarchaeota archaeon]